MNIDTSNKKLRTIKNKMKSLILQLSLDLSRISIGEKKTCLSVSLDICVFLLLIEGMKKIHFEATEEAGLAFK